MLDSVQGQSEGVSYLRKIVDGSMTTPLLLVGEEGTGRRLSVVEAAKEVFREDDPERCPQCYRINQGIHPDLRIVLPEDGKDIKVATIRNLIGEAGYLPLQAPLKFLVVDGADRMTTAASDALLKVLEEAPSAVRFFLLAEDSRRVIPTIRSRCAAVRYRRLSEDFIMSVLAEHTDDMKKALVYTRLADGSVGRAVRYLGSGRLMLRDHMLGLLKTGLSGDLSKLFPAVDTLESDLQLGLRFLEHILCDLVLLPHYPSHITNVDKKEELESLRKQIGSERLGTLREEFKLLSSRIKGSLNLSYHVKSLLTTTFA